MFLVNSRLGLFSVTNFGSICKKFHLTLVVLLPKLRTQFAEFLNVTSLKRLRMLFSPTCVGLRYGSNVPMLRGFSWQQRLSHFTALRLSSSDLSLEKVRICLNLKPTSLNLDSNTRLTYLSASPHRSTLKYWNINQFPFDYALQPRLRGRLTRS